MTDKQIIIYKKECYNEPHCSLNQVLEQLNAYKMEADEGKEINAELKAENEELKATFDDLFKGQYKLADNCKKLRQCFTEIKEIAEEYQKEYIVNNGVVLLCNQIFQKISECEGNDE